MLNLNIHAVDLALEVNGVWCMYQPGIKFLIARQNNSRYLAGLDSLHTEYGVEFERLPQEEKQRLMLELMADTIVLGWRGLNIKGGEQYPHTKENVVAMFMDDRYKDVFAFVQKRSKTSSLYWEQELVEQGNV